MRQIEKLRVNMRFDSVSLDVSKDSFMVGSTVGPPEIRKE